MSDTLAIAELQNLRRRRNRQNLGGRRSQDFSRAQQNRITWEQLNRLAVGTNLQLNTTMRKPRRRILGTYLEHTDSDILLDTQNGETTVARRSVTEIVDRTAVGRFRVDDAVLIAPSRERAVVIEVDAPMVRVMRASDLHDPDFHLSRITGWVHEDELRLPDDRRVAPRAHPGTAGDFVVEEARSEEQMAFGRPPL